MSQAEKFASFLLQTPHEFFSFHENKRSIFHYELWNWQIWAVRKERWINLWTGCMCHDSVVALQVSLSRAHKWNEFPVHAIHHNWCHGSYRGEQWMSAWYDLRLKGKEAHFMQSNKGQRCDLCGKGEAKTRDKDASLQINNVQALCSFCNAKCKKQIVQIVQCKTTASVSEVIVMFQDNWQSKSDRKNQMREE